MKRSGANHAEISRLRRELEWAERGVRRGYFGVDQVALRKRNNIARRLFQLGVKL